MRTSQRKSLLLATSVSDAPLVCNRLLLICGYTGLVAAVCYLFVVIIVARVPLANSGIRSLALCNHARNLQCHL